MRWSTASFGVGLGVGLLVAFVLGPGLAVLEPDGSRVSDRPDVREHVPADLVGPGNGPGRPGVTARVERRAPFDLADEYAASPQKVRNAEWVRLSLELEDAARGLAGAPLDLAAAVAMSRADWARAWKAAEAWGIGDRAPSPDLVEGMLSSTDGEDLLLAIGLAARCEPPLLDVLCRVAADASYGSFRAVAVVALAHHRDRGDAIIEAFRAAVRDPEPHVRLTAIEFLAHLGAPAAPIARDLLISGEGGVEHREALVGVAVLGDPVDVIRFATSSLEPDVSMALLEALAARSEGGVTEMLRAVIPGMVRLLLRSPRHAERAIEIVAGHPGTAEMAADLRARLLADGGTPPPMMRELLGRVDPEEVNTPGLLGVLSHLARRHPDPDIRDHARELYQRAEPGDLEGLTIVSATYGKGEALVDVREPLERRAAVGRLTIRASNDLAGDPLFGTVKDLVVTYTYRGRRHVRTVAEGQVLAIP